MTKKKGKKVALIVSGVLLGLVAIFILIVVLENIFGKSYFAPNMVLKSDGTYAGAGIKYMVGSKADTLEYPAEYEGEPVTEIYGWHESRSDFSDKIKTVIVPEGVTKIGDYAFSGYTNLERAVLPSTLKEMGLRVVASDVVLEFAGNEYYTFNNGCVIETASKALVMAFDNCTIPSDVKIIREAACCNTLLGEVFLPNVKTVEASAFEGSTVTSVSFPSAETIEQFAFHNCTLLKTVTFTTALRLIEWYAFEGCPIEDFYFNGTLEELEAIDAKASGPKVSKVSEEHHLIYHLADGDVQGF